MDGYEGNRRIRHDEAPAGVAAQLRMVGLTGMCCALEVAGWQGPGWGVLHKPFTIRPASAMTSQPPYRTGRAGTDRGRSAVCVLSDGYGASSAGAGPWPGSARYRKPGR